MIKDLTIGQYYNTESLIHGLDARTKLVITLVYAVSLFFCNNIYLFLLATLFLCLYVAGSHVPVGYILRGLKFVWFFIFMTAVFNLFDGEGRVLLHWKIFKITEGGLISTGLVAFRFFYLIIGSSILTYTTLPVNMTDGLEHLFGFLKKIRVPVSELAMIMTIALRFIPIIMEELDKLTKAQMSRGADFESGNIAKRIKAYAPVFIPLFVSAVRRASELAMAMDARCYQGGEGRTRLRPLSYTGKDLAAFVILAVYIALICVGRIMPLVLKG